MASSLADENWTVSTVGVASSQPMSWNTSGMHTVQVRAIDGDGASSEAKQGTLMVHNVPPTVTGLIPYEAVIEDNPLELTVVPDDTLRHGDPGGVLGLGCEVRRRQRR